VRAIRLLRLQAQSGSLAIEQILTTGCSAGLTYRGTILNLIFLAVAAVLAVRFLRTGGPAMLKMMGGPATHYGHGKAGDPDHDTH
jgi:hypothetical protein